MLEIFLRRMRDLNPRDSRLRVFETRALGHYANPPVGRILLKLLESLGLAKLYPKSANFWATSFADGLVIELLSEKTRVGTV